MLSQKPQTNCKAILADLWRTGEELVRWFLLWILSEEAHRKLI